MMDSAYLLLMAAFAIWPYVWYRSTTKTPVGLRGAVSNVYKGVVLTAELVCEGPGGDEIWKESKRVVAGDKLRVRMQSGIEMDFDLSATTLVIESSLVENHDARTATTRKLEAHVRPGAEVVVSEAGFAHDGMYRSGLRAGAVVHVIDQTRQGVLRGMRARFVGATALALVCMAAVLLPPDVRTVAECAAALLGGAVGLRLHLFERPWWQRAVAKPA